MAFEGLALYYEPIISDTANFVRDSNLLMLVSIYVNSGDLFIL